MTAVDRVFVDYAKVSNSHLVQLEIHVLGIPEEDGVDAAAWFDETTHVQEITNTLMPVMQVRVANWCNKEGEKRSTTLKGATPLHVEGDSLRLSYSFARRSLSHQCVIINCTDRHLRRRQRRSLVVFTEKLVVHVYHLAGYNRLKNFEKGLKQTSLNFKRAQKRLVSNGEVNVDRNNSNKDGAIPSSSMAVESESKTSLYFDGEIYSTQPQKRILRNIVKKSRPKLSKSSRKEKLEQEALAEDQHGPGKDQLNSHVAATTTLYQDQCGSGKDALGSHVAGTITLDEDQCGPGKDDFGCDVVATTVLDPLISIEDSGIGHGDTTTADVIDVDKSQKLQKSSAFCSVRDSDDEDTSLLTRDETKRLHRSKARQDVTEVEVRVADVEKGRDSTHAKKLSAKQQGLTLGGKLDEQDTGQSDCEPAVRLKGGRKEQRKLRLRRTAKTARPFTMPASPDSSSCDSHAMGNRSPVWKVSLLSVAQEGTPFEKLTTEKTSQLEKLHKNARSGNLNSSGEAVLPIYQSYGAKNSVTGNRKKAATASSGSSTKPSKRKKTSEKTSSKLATILKEMDEDILGNSVSDADCRVAPSRARTVVASDISLITKHDSFYFDPFAVRHTKKSVAERSLKANRNEGGSRLDGAVTELRRTKRRRLSSDDSCGSSPPKSLLGHSQSNNNADDDLDESGDDNHFEPGEFVSLPRNATKRKRKQIDKRPTKIQSIHYRISAERRKRLATILNSDSDCDNVMIDGNDGSAASRRSSSVGMVSQYFQRAMQSGSRSTSTEKISDKEEEDAEKVLIEDLFNDCFIDETKSSPVVVVETPDKGPEDINAEITRIKRVCDLTEKQLLHLVKKNKYYLKNIFEGKAPCKRHSDYKKGGKTRLGLNYLVPLNLFQEEQPDTIVSALVGIFCKNTGSKYLDYLLKVLLPEILIKIYMDVHGTTRTDAVETMAHARPLMQEF